MRDNNYYGLALRCENGVSASAMPLVFLAAPYSPVASEQLWDAAQEAANVAALLREHGYEVFCPVCHDAVIAEQHAAPWKTSRRVQQSVLRHADAVVVLNVYGGRAFENVEVLHAVYAASALGIPVNIATPGIELGVDGELAVEPGVDPALFRTPAVDEHGMARLQIVPQKAD